MPWIPTIVAVTTIAGGGMVANYQLGQNTEAIKSKVSISAYETDKEFARDARIRLAAELDDLSESVDENEDAIESLERSDLQSSGEIKLQIERLQAEQRSLYGEQSRELDALQRQLELMLQLLQQNSGDTPNPFNP